MPAPSTLALAALTFIASATAESTVTMQITGYGAASNDPAGSSTICCGLQGSERSATFSDPGVVATDNDAYPIGTKFYIPGLQKYFVAQDSCEQCATDHDNGIEHIDIWIGPTGYQDYNNLLACAEHDGSGSATVIVDPNDGYPVDSTPLMNDQGQCDGNVDYSRTSPSGGGSGGSTGGGGSSGGGGDCDWAGHCQGASCSTDDDCGDPYSCQNDVCS